MATAPNPQAAPAPTAVTKKTFFDTVLTATPVLLTVVATFMVGQSTGEMTRAQYFRAIASQNQSKAGDQWAFFQAKRIRGTSYEVTASLLGTLREPAPFSAATLMDTPERMGAALSRVSEKLKSATDDRATHLRGEVDAWLAETKDVLHDTRTLLNGASQPGDSQAGRFTSEAVEAALAALDQASPKKTARPAKGSLSADDPGGQDLGKDRAHLLNEVIDGIKKRQPESALARKVLKISDSDLQLAVAEAERKADLVYREGKQLESVLEHIDKLVERQTRIGRAFLTAHGRFVQPNSAATSSGSLVQELQPLADSIRAALDRLGADYKTARYAFTARRYEADARSNQDSAYLYEVKVYQASARSDRHLLRSKNFLYAMLVAQVGVTIASLALRRKSLVWMLAAAAGIIAIGFGAYVFLDMG